MRSPTEQWHSLMSNILDSGHGRPDRTGVGTLSLFGVGLRFAPEDFPAVTTKKLAWGQVTAEMACFIRGYTKLSDFHQMGCKIWDKNAQGRDDLGPIYGAQWRNWGGRDQLKELVEGLRADRYSRRHIVSAWNVSDLSKMCLPPCPVMFQCYYNGDSIDMMVTQRSADVFLGLPFDMAGYSLLHRLICREVDMPHGALIMALGDAHIYVNHMNAAEEVLKRDPEKYDPPTLELFNRSLFDFHPADCALTNYNSYPSVKAVMNL